MFSFLFKKTEIKQPIMGIIVVSVLLLLVLPVSADDALYLNLESIPDDFKENYTENLNNFILAHGNNSLLLENLTDSQFWKDKTKEMLAQAVVSLIRQSVNVFGVDGQSIAMNFGEAAVTLSFPTYISISSEILGYLDLFAQIYDYHQWAEETVMVSERWAESIKKVVAYQAIWDPAYNNLVYPFSCGEEGAIGILNGENCYGFPGFASRVYGLDDKNYLYSEIEYVSSGSHHSLKTYPLFDFDYGRAALNGTFLVNTCNNFVKNELGMSENCPSDYSLKNVKTLLNEVLENEVTEFEMLQDNNTTTAEFRNQLKLTLTNLEKLRTQLSALELVLFSYIHDDDEAWCDGNYCGINQSGCYPLPDYNECCREEHIWAQYKQINKALKGNTLEEKDFNMRNVIYNSYLTLVSIEKVVDSDFYMHLIMYKLIENHPPLLNASMTLNENEPYANITWHVFDVNNDTINITIFARTNNSEWNEVYRTTTASNTSGSYEFWLYSLGVTDGFDTSIELMVNASDGELTNSTYFTLNFHHPNFEHHPHEIEDSEHIYLVNRGTNIVAVNTEKGEIRLFTLGLAASYSLNKKVSSPTLMGGSGYLLLLDKDGYLHEMNFTANSVSERSSIYVGSTDANLLPPAVSDVDGDGQKEVVVVTHNVTSKLHILKSGWDYEELEWSPIEVNDYVKDFALGDLNADGKDEIILLGDHLRAYTYQGYEIFNKDLSSYDFGVETIAVGDINDDGLVEIVLSGVNQNGSVILVYSSSGTYLGGRILNDENVSQIFLFNGDDERGLELAVASEDKLHFFDLPDLSEIANIQISAERIIASDIDSDGYDEVIGLAPPRIYAWNLDGSVANKFPIGLARNSTTIVKQNSNMPQIVSVDDENLVEFAFPGKACDMEGDSRRTSNSNYTSPPVLAPNVEIISPSGGETYPFQNPIQINWSVNDGASVSLYYSRDKVNWSFIASDVGEPPYNWSVSSFDLEDSGAYYLLVKAQKGSYVSYAMTPEPFYIDANAPVIYEFNISNDASYVSSYTVYLYVNATNATEMRFRNYDSNGDWSQWQTFSPKTKWTLSGGEGYKIVQVECKNDAGNTASAFDTVYLDLYSPEKPEVYAVGNFVGSEFDNKSYAVSPVMIVFGSSDNVSGISKYLVNISRDGNLTEISIPSEYPMDYPLLDEEGNYSIKVKACDGTGRWSVWSDPLNLSIDLNPPSKPELISPLNATANLNFHWSESQDNVSGVYSYYFTIWNETWSASWGWYNTYFHIPSDVHLSNGKYRWSVKVKDNAGHETFSDTTEFFYDTVKPHPPKAINITTNSTEVKVSWEPASDDVITFVQIKLGFTTIELPINLGGSGIDHYELKVSGPNQIQYEITTESTSYTLNLLPGMWYYQVRAYDKAGLASNWSYGEIRVDQTPPPPPVLEPYIIDTFPANISWSKVSDFSGIAGYQLEFIGEDENFTLFTPAHYITLPAVFNGTYTLRIRAFDNAGNMGDYNETSFQAVSPSENSPPQIEFVSPDGIKVGRICKFELKSTDPDGDKTYWDIMLGENPESLEKVAAGINGTRYYLTLQPNKTYYWKAILRDEHSYEVESNLMSFKTAKLPLAEFTIPENVTQYELTLFRSQSMSYEGTEVEESWWFDDWTESVGREVYHIFTTPGSHLVRLTVKDAYGESSVYRLVEVKGNRDVIHVDDDEADYSNPDYKNLNDAIMNSNDGDTIVVHSGNYTINVELKNVKVVGVGEVNITDVSNFGLSTLRGSPALFYDVKFMPDLADYSGSTFVNCKFNRMTTENSRFYDSSMKFLEIYENASVHHCEITEGIRLVSGYPDIERCTMNGKKIIYLKNQDNFSIQYEAQAIILNSSDFEVSGDTDGVSYPLQILNSKNFNATVKAFNTSEIWLNQVSNSNITVVTDGEVFVEGAEEVSIQGNLSSIIASGISNSTLRNSSILDYSEIANSNGLLITKNEFETLRLYAVTNSTIKNNDIAKLQLSGGYFPTKDNVFYLNSLKSVKFESGVAYNSWNSTERLSYTFNNSSFVNYLGNYWANFSGSDNNSDGIIDSAYVLSITGNIDYYPLIEKPDNYVLTTPQIHGDFNENGRVDISDVVKVAYMVIDKIKQDLRADFNNNGRVDIGDLAKIAYYLLGKIKKL